MSEFAQTALQNFTNAHALIIDSLADLENDLHSPYVNAKPKIRNLQTLVFAYFQLQKDIFYKIIRDFYLDDPQALKYLEFLVEDLKDIKVKSLIFFDAHPADMGDLRPGNLVTDFHFFSQQLMMRFNSEKKYLFPLVEKITLL